MKAKQEQTIESDQSMIPNTQIESMFLRICSDEEMAQYTKLIDESHISLATAYASNKVYKLFYMLVEHYENRHGDLEYLKNEKKK